MMKEHQPCNCARPSLNISLGFYPPDEKSAYVDSVCRTLMESRFGWEANYRSIVEFDYLPEWLNDPRCDADDWAFDVTARLGLHARRFLNFPPVPKPSQLITEFITSWAIPLLANALETMPCLIYQFPLARGSPKPA